MNSTGEPPGNGDLVSPLADGREFAGQFAEQLADDPQLPYDTHSMATWFARAVLHGQSRERARTSARLQEVRRHLRVVRWLMTFWLVLTAADVILLIWR